MSLCDTCRDPGHCCRRLRLWNEAGKEPTSWADRGLDGAQDAAVAFAAPFMPIEVAATFTDSETGREFVSWWWRCDALMPDGRCGMYELRPALCRSYEPASSALCAEFVARDAPTEPV